MQLTLVQQKIEKLEKEIENIKQKQELSLSDESALAVLRNTVNELKTKGIKSVDLIVLHHETKLPVLQISKLMNALEKEGVVSYHDK